MSLAHGPGVGVNASPCASAFLSLTFAHPPLPTSLPGDVSVMEFLTFLIILCAAWLVWRRPERERLAFRLMFVSCVLMAILFLIGTHTSLIPRVNL